MSDRPVSPLLEFDDDPHAIIEPSMVHSPVDGLPSSGVITWMQDAFDELVSRHGSEIVYRFTVETATVEVHRVELDEGPVAAAVSHVGAPVAAALFETMVAIGCRTTVAVGSSGGLVAELPPGTVVVPDAAIRDEGTSHHYLAPSRLAHPDPELQDRLRLEFRRAGIEPVTGHVWTTDAFFRETAARVEARVAEGAIAVDMELSALSAIARFRGVRHGHAVYMADTLFGDTWDPTDLVERDTAYRLRLLECAARACAGAG